MQGPAHVGVGWLIGELAGLGARRDRRIVGLAGLVPDVDVVSYPLAYLWFGADIDRAYAVYAAVHHQYTHGIGFAVLCAVGAWFLASHARRVQVAGLTLLAVVTHIAGDVIASGPSWPVYPLWPFADIAWSAPWSWNASDWRNITLSALAIVMTLAYAWRKGYSPVECFSFRADAWMAAVMRGEVQSSRRFRIVLYVCLLTITAAIVLPLVLYMR